MMALTYNMLKNKGQITLGVAVLGLIGTILASAITSWGTAGTRVSQVDTKVQLVELEHKKDLEAINKEFENINGRLEALLKHFNVEYVAK